MNLISTRLKLDRLGWTVFALGLAWDVLYHARLFFAPSVVTDTVDFIGSLGHVVTFVGIALVL